MIRVKKKLTLPEYRERKEVYELLGYKEISVEEKGYKAIVTYEIDETDKHYSAIRHFLLLSLFVIFMAFKKEAFDLVSNALGFLLPAFVSLALAVVYTYLYFNINKRIIEESPYLKDNLSSIVNSIKNK